MHTRISRGFFGVGIYSSKTELNVSNLFRSALAFQADFLYVIGTRYKQRKADTCKAPKHIPLYHYKGFDDFYDHLPNNCKLVSVECGDDIQSFNLRNYCHPERACYLLGAEDFGVPHEYLDRSHSIIHIETRVCLNVATTGAIIMYDRSIKK